MIKWSEIKSGVKNIVGLSKPDNPNKQNKHYIQVLVENLEEKIDLDEKLIFKIEQVKNNGFSVKVNGLFAYVSFYYMPWRYPNIDNWRDIAHTLTGKYFTGKVFDLKKDPLFILMNGSSHTFNNIELIKGGEYKAIIVNKTNYGLFIDIGYHFDWKYGSFFGLLHKSNLENEELFENNKNGDIIETLYCGENSIKQLIFGNNDKIRNWITENVHELQGQVVSASINKQGGAFKVLVNNKFKGTLPINKEIYPEEPEKLKIAKRNLIDKDVIQCKVLKINDNKMSIQLKWNCQEEIEAIYLRNIEPLKGEKRKGNNFNDKAVEKLQLIGQLVNVEVEKNDTGNKYIVENRYLGKLIISNKSTLITTKEKEMIESNLQEGEILNCEVTGVNEDFIKIRWFIKNEELMKFTKL